MSHTHQGQAGQKAPAGLYLSDRSTSGTGTSSAGERSISADLVDRLGAVHSIEYIECELASLDPSAVATICSTLGRLDGSDSDAMTVLDLGQIPLQSTELDPLDAILTSIDAVARQADVVTLLDDGGCGLGDELRMTRLGR